MKRNFLVGLAMGLLLVGIGVGNAIADTIIYYEEYTPGTDFLMAQGQTESWVFDITDNSGWSTPGQTFNDGSITLYLEDNDPSSNEEVTFVFISPDVGEDITQKLTEPDWTFDVYASSFSDGLIGVQLTAKKGDFYFRSAELGVTSYYNTSGDTVPEPATVILFGLGLLGVAGVSRKKLQK